MARKEKNIFGKKLKKVLSDHAWRLTVQHDLFHSSDLTLDQLSYLVGICYQIVKDEEKK